MKPVLTVFTFGIGALLFVSVFATLKPAVVTAASGPAKPGQCSTKAPPAFACHSLTFATAWWPGVGQHN